MSTLYELNHANTRGLCKYLDVH